MHNRCASPLCHYGSNGKIADVKLVDMQQSFNTVFVIAGILPLLASVIVLTVTGKIELMRLPGISQVPAPMDSPAVT